MGKMLVAAVVAVLLTMSGFSLFVRAVSDDLHLMTMVVEHPLIGTLDPTDNVFPYDRRLYRPLTQDLYFRVLYPLFGMWAVPYHLINLTLMYANAFIVFFLARRIFGAREAGLWATLFYALTPLNRMPFTRICYIQDVLMVFLALAAVAAFVRGREAGDRPGGRPLGWSALGAGLYALSLLAKESSLLLPAILWAVDFFTGRGDEPVVAWVRRRIVPHLPFDLAAALYLAFRLVYIPPSPDGAYAMVLGANVVARLSEYLSDAAGSVVPFFPVRSGLSAYFLAAAAAALLAGLWWRRPKIPAMAKAGLAWFGLGLLIFLPLTLKSANYFISFASIGFFWAAGAAAAGVFSRARNYAVPAAAAFVALMAAANLRVNYKEFKTHDLTISRETHAIQVGIKALRPEFPDGARVVLLLNTAPDFPPTSFGVGLLYDRPLTVMFADRAFDVLKGDHYRYLPRPGVDYRNTFIFGFADDGFCELELRNGRLAIRECV